MILLYYVYTPNTENSRKTTYFNLYPNCDKKYNMYLS